MQNVLAIVRRMRVHFGGPDWTQFFGAPLFQPFELVKDESTIVQQITSCVPTARSGPSGWKSGSNLSNAPSLQTHLSTTAKSLRWGAFHGCQCTFVLCARLVHCGQIARTMSLAPQCRSSGSSIDASITRLSNRFLLLHSYFSWILDLFYSFRYWALFWFNSMLKHCKKQQNFLQSCTTICSSTPSMVGWNRMINFGLENSQLLI